MFFRYAYNKRTEARFTNGITSGPAQDGQLPLERPNQSGVDRLGAHGGLVVRGERAHRSEPVPRARALGSGIEVRPS